MSDIEPAKPLPGQLDLFPEPTAEHQALVWRQKEDGTMWLDGTPCICPLCNPPAKKRRK